MQHFVVRVWATITVTINNVATPQLRMMRVYNSSASNDYQARQEAIAQFAIDFPSVSVQFCETLWMGGVLL